MPGLYTRPSDILLPYQKAWVDAGRDSKLMFVLQARQTGKSFMLAAEAVEDGWCNGPNNWICLSSGERAAEEWLLKAEKYCRWVQAFNPKLSYQYKSSEIRLANGSRIIAIPAKPETARGYTGNLILDEFSAHENQEAIWAATYPYITNPLSGNKKLRVAGTPIGKANFFWNIWSSNPHFTKFKNTIYDCQAKGLKVDVEEIRRGLGDDDIFRQEYLLEPLEENTQLFAFDLLKKSTYKQLPQFRKPSVYLGIDIGRYKDKTSIVTLVVETDGEPDYYVTDVEVLDSMEYVAQEAAIAEVIRRTSPLRVTVDAAGIGSELTENLQRHFGGLINAYVATNQTKVEGYNHVKRLMSQGHLHLPDDEKLLKEFTTLRRIVTQNGMKYEAQRGQEGHADKASGVQMAVTGALMDLASPAFLPIAF